MACPLAIAAAAAAAAVLPPPPAPTTGAYDAAACEAEVAQRCDEPPRYAHPRHSLGSTHTDWLRRCVTPIKTATAIATCSHIRSSSVIDIHNPGGSHRPPFIVIRHRAQSTIHRYHVVTTLQQSSIIGIHGHCRPKGIYRPPPIVSHCRAPTCCHIRLATSAWPSLMCPSSLMGITQKHSSPTAARHPQYCTAGHSHSSWMLYEG